MNAASGIYKAVWPASLQMRLFSSGCAQRSSPCATTTQTATEYGSARLHPQHAAPLLEAAPLLPLHITLGGRSGFTRHYPAHSACGALLIALFFYAPSLFLWAEHTPQQLRAIHYSGLRATSHRTADSETRYDSFKFIQTDEANEQRAEVFTGSVSRDL